MAERVVVIDHGEIIADAAPHVLKRDHADDVLTVLVAGGDPATLRAALPAGPEDVVVHEPGSGDDRLRLVVSTANGAERLPGIIEALRLAGLHVSSASVKQASLDDVFLNLTGRSLREEAAA
jgi:ABC-2 type transport system ATP-binding protein